MKKVSVKNPASLFPFLQELDLKRLMVQFYRDAMEIMKNRGRRWYIGS